MSNQQLYVLIGIPMLFNAALIGILTAYINAKLETTNHALADLRSHVDQRFDDMRDLWRAELRRVEEVLDARLKHLEER